MDGFKEDIVLKGHENSVSCVKFSKDGLLLGDLFLFFLLFVCSCCCLFVLIVFVSLFQCGQKCESLER